MEMLHSFFCLLYSVVGCVMQLRAWSDYTTENRDKALRSAFALIFCVVVNIPITIYVMLRFCMHVYLILVNRTARSFLKMRSGAPLALQHNFSTWTDDPGTVSAKAKFRFIRKLMQNDSVF
jgi:hypothetical protein